MAPLADVLEELAADSKLKSEVVFCPGLERFVEFDLRGKTNPSDDDRQARAMGRGTGGGGAAGGNGTHDVGIMEALEDLYFALHPLLVPLDLLRNGLQRDIAHDVGRLGGVITRGRVAEEDANDTIASGREKFHVHWAVDAIVHQRSSFTIHLLREPSRLSIQHRLHGGLLCGTFDDVHAMFLA